MLVESGSLKNVILTPRENNKSPPDWKFADRFIYSFWDPDGGSL